MVFGLFVCLVGFGLVVSFVVGLVGWFAGWLYKAFSTPVIFYFFLARDNFSR